MSAVGKEARAAAWPRNPLVYEIFTWVWLAEVSARAGTPVTLATVAAAEWDAIAALGFDAVWFMGVWERSPVGAQEAWDDLPLRAEFGRMLPDVKREDDIGSAYCVRRYEADAHLGGRAGLAAARRALAERGVKLILDFVPNHVAPDHPWAKEKPELFIQGDAADRARDPRSFLEVGGRVIACGRDPNFPAWSDVLQLHLFAPELRRAMIETLCDIATQCDGVRCDMAMLPITSIFARTWGERAGAPPATEYWRELIPAVRAKHPGFRFIAEAYWDLEWELHQQGFDWCYDKRLYDRLEHQSAEAVRLHLCADLPYQQKLLRFVENHDEPRAAAAFPLDKARAVAVATLTLPGMRLVHDGQLEGRKVRIHVHLGRRPAEAPDAGLRAFYEKLLRAANDAAIREGEWRLCERRGWPDNRSHMNIVAWTWRAAEVRRLVIVNLSGARSQALVAVPWGDARGRRWRLDDALTGESLERDGDALGEGLYVDLAPWGAHCWSVRAAEEGA